MSAKYTAPRLIYFYLCLFIVAIGLYSNTFKHGFVLDDDIVFQQNKYVQQGISAIPEIISHGFLYGFNGKNDQSYRPLVTVDFAIEKSLFGADPHAHHKMNVLYYAIVCCLLFSFLHLLFQKQNPWMAFWISLLYTLHPVHTEVVANIKSRDELLQAVFLLLSLIYFLRFIDFKKYTYLTIALVSYFLALLCKEMAVTYVLLLPLVLWFFRDLKIKKILQSTAFVVGVLLVYMLLRHWILDTITFDEKMTILNNGISASETFGERIATTIYIFANYIKLLFYPSPLAWDYSYPHFEIVSFGNIVVILTTIITLALSIFSLIKLPSKNKYGFAFLFFVISFSIVSNFFILIGSTLGERFLFFPSIAFCFFLVFALKEVLSFAMKNSQMVLRGILIIIAIAYSFKTYDRNKDWKSSETLFIAGAEATPDNSRAISALGTVNRQLAERSPVPREKFAYYKKAEKNYIRSTELLPSNAEAHYNLGVVYMAMNESEKAKSAFQSAIKHSPDMLNAYNNLGVIYFNARNYEVAKGYMEKCLAINPDFQSAVANLGAIYHNLGNKEMARKYYLRALELNPNDINSRNNLKKL